MFENETVADVLLGPLPPPGPTQIVQVLAQARAAVAAALADPAADRSALALALEIRARWAEQAPGGWMYAAELRMLIGPLGVTPDEI